MAGYARKMGGPGSSPPNGFLRAAERRHKKCGSYQEDDTVPSMPYLKIAAFANEIDLLKTLPIG